MLSDPILANREIRSSAIPFSNGGPQKFLDNPIKKWDIATDERQRHILPQIKT
jgi:hypothetical protein